MQRRRIKLGKLEKNTSDLPYVQNCLKCLRNGNSILAFLFGLHLYILIFLFVYSCTPAGDRFHMPNGDRYEFVQQMRKILVTHEMVYISASPSEDIYKAPENSVLKQTALKIRQSSVQLSYENGDVKQCTLFDSLVRTSGFIIMCYQEVINLVDWGQYNMLFEDPYKCFQATLYDGLQKVNLEAHKQCNNLYKIFERHTLAAHVRMNIETLTDQGYVLETNLTTSIVLRYHNENPARWALQEIHKKPRKENSEQLSDFVLFETSVLDLELVTKESGDLQNGESCLGIKFRSVKDSNSKEKFYNVELTEQCGAIARLYEQTKTKISRTYTFHELIQVEDHSFGSDVKYIPNIYRVSTFVFNFSYEGGKPTIYYSGDKHGFTKIDLQSLIFQDLRQNKFQDKYCYKMVINYDWGFGPVTLFHNGFCEQLYIDTQYIRNLEKYHTN